MPVSELLCLWLLNHDYYANFVRECSFFQRRTVTVTVRQSSHHTRYEVSQFPSNIHDIHLPQQLYNFSVLVERLPYGRDSQYSSVTIKHSYLLLARNMKASLPWILRFLSCLKRKIEVNNFGGS